MTTKKSRGRQKIEMTRMSKESNLLVTFSKRRSGLFKKASELCTLCGAEIAIIIFSPGKKAFSFGHPSVDSILERFLSPPRSLSASLSTTTSTLQIVEEAHRSAGVRELNTQLNELMTQMAEEKRRGEELSQMRKAMHGGGRWWEAPIEEMGVEELEQLKAAMEDLRKNVSVMMGTSPPMPTFLGVAPPVSGGGGNNGGFDVVETKSNNPVSGLGQLCVTPQGYTLGFGHSFF